MPSDGSQLKIVSMMMDMEGWRAPLGNEARLLLAEELMTWTREVACAHLVLFPASYLCAPTLAKARKLAERVMTLARQKSIAFVMGVDLCATGGFKKGSGKAGSQSSDLPDLLVAQGQLPFFLFAWSPGEP
ncbi:MAG: hypothetical protein ACXU86_20450, partial [Archangium sp.]